MASYQNGTDAAYSYTYDANGNITGITQGTASFTYEYDKANQLIRENLYYGSGNSNNATYTYEYDAWGNILNKKKYAYTTGTLGSVLNTKTYGYTNTQWGDLLASYNGSTITYDAMGNMASYGSKTYSWEGKQLVEINVMNSLYYTFSYDENGLRTSKTLTWVSDNTSVATEYYYNGSVLIGMKTGSTVMRFSYDAGGNVVSVDYSEDNGANFTTYYYLRNAQSDIVKLIDGSGNAVVEYTYDSWGKPVSVTGILSGTLGEDQPFRYRGYVYDSDTQLYYLQSRYYDPKIGRFISADVLLSTGQGVIGHNSFAYCNNSPVFAVDSNGAYPVAVPINEATEHDHHGAGMPVDFYCYDRESAKEAIDKLFAEEGYNEDVEIFFYKTSACINNSHLVHSSSVRMKICVILEHTEGFYRKAGNLAAEWEFHNAMYYATFFNTWPVKGIHNSAEHVNLDYIIEYEKEERPLLPTIYSILDSLGIH